MNDDIHHKIKAITSLEQDVRDYINTTRYQNELIRDGDNWNQICCSLDTIGDTLYAIGDYVDSDYPQSVGLQYLASYGLLQAFFIQQDAIVHLSEAFGIKYQLSKELKKVRFLRSASIGHPTKQDRGTPTKHTYYNYISRPTLSKGGFTLMQSYDQDKTIFIDVDFTLVMQTQLGGVLAAYQELVDTLKEADKMHKEEYKSKPLIDIFHSAMRYYFEKIAQGIHAHNESDVRFGISMLEGVEKTYEKFEAALRERGDINSYTEYDLNEYKHALFRLKNYLEGDDQSMSESDALIYHFYMREQHKHFEQIAKEVDDSYQE